MNNIPTWWLVLSGLFFFANLVFFVGLTIAALKLVEIIRGLLPKVDALSKEVVEISHKVQGIATQVEGLTESLKNTATSVGGRATSVAGSVELVASSAGRQFERFAPFITGALTAIRLAKALNEMRAGRSPANATSKKVLTNTPAAKTPPRKRLFGVL